MVHREEPPEAGYRHSDEHPAGRPVVRGTQGIVSSGHYLTSMSGMRMLLDGGNAFDAAVAAGFTAAVVEPLASFSLATEGSFLLYHAASGRVQTLSGQGVAAGRATIELFKQRGLDVIPTGPGPNTELCFTVPGVVDAFILTLETYGTKTLCEVIAPAIGYAQHGFPMYDVMQRRLVERTAGIEQFRRYPPGGMDIFYPGGAAPEVGQMLVQKQLAATMAKLAQAESDAGRDRLAGLQAARETFYRGDIARTIVECSERIGGLLSLDDLASYRAKFEEPIWTTFMGHEICTQSTWTQGAVLLQALNILERFDLRSMGHNSPQYIHTVAEALKLAFADRERYYGDPDYAEVPLDGLLSKEYAAARAKLIRDDAACPELPQAGDPWRYVNGAVRSAGSTAVVAKPLSGDTDVQDSDGTTHFAVIDRDKNMVSATCSGGILARSVFFPELGCTLSTRSEMFYLDPKHPNGLQPGKRPRTTIVNYMVCKGGRPIMTLGCPGAESQTQGNLQTMLNVLVFGMDLQEAVAAPRFSSQSVPSSFYPHEYRPGTLAVEAGIPSDARIGLEGLGHKITDEETCGEGALITRYDPETAELSSGADPRLQAYALAW